MKEITLTERGQVTLPSELRRKLRLRPGQKLQFEVVSDNEFRVFAPKGKVAGPMLYSVLTDEYAPSRAVRRIG